MSSLYCCAQHSFLVRGSPLPPKAKTRGRAIQLIPYRQQPSSRSAAFLQSKTTGNHTTAFEFFHNLKKFTQRQESKGLRSSRILITSNNHTSNYKLGAPLPN
ncbi:hypothetical protein AMS68_006734 [Peltaster fructicola]|uniref:Uncharacterized protein n=1 Tax=Peltaster fructicola TaxID=286661 RepID=A0A6H0Y2I3_9PEZI|nr:hypothetical protein AMS68_006734 [Peltaster fructicola]